MEAGLRRLTAPLVAFFTRGAAGRLRRQRARSDVVLGGASTSSLPTKCFALIIGVSFVALLCGCATAPSAPDQRVSPRAIAVIASSQAPIPTIGVAWTRPPPPTSDQLALGAAAGVGAVALGALAIAVAPMAAGQGALLVMQGLGLLAGTAVAAAGDSAKPPAESPQVAIERALDSALVDLPLSELSAKAAVDAITTFTPWRAEAIEDPGAATEDAVRDYATLQARGFTHALEIRMTRAGIALWHGSDSLGVIAVARLIDASTGKTTWTKGLFYSAAGRSADDLLRDQAAPARREFEHAARVLGERAVESLLLGTEFPASSNSLDTCGLVVTDPAPLWSRFLSGAHSPAELVGPSAVGSLTPALAWEPPSRRLVGASPWASATDIRYDVRLWSSDGEIPKELVYERIGLAEARHKVETPLAPGSTYFWSVRIRAVVAGNLRSTPWSIARYPEFAPPYGLPSGRAESDKPQKNCRSADCGCLDFIPPANFYRFRTP